ncbi:single-stranded-DNA-specific exonuclease RecJ [Odoribacter laneus]|uniref:Single-stranded-DNA-specific exonuclease RecJ n=2 Tax=Odoribacter laneus TaxID=626933 RepID=H1DGQ9_9BACT|nr:single-stranded-DNA-specific exonuclease RecJ [Odoribacter laneus]EHP47592.1 single-stranded-DNA-specific exonuclease RecJ [Odoribacter laneus YIT 12061]MBS1446819.1 single-stranded-DNA-specific exonuclease RecJ [Odoribacter sp.]CCZ80625.1 single-stranded-DNA-specific exonuclease RecJ [Odoribacter laneus CAG:561]
MKKRWVINTPPEENKILKLAYKLNCPPVIANLLLQRDIDTAEKAQAFFYPSLNMLHDPFLMKDMDKAVDRLDKAIAQEEKILIYGDYDVDGTTAVALLYKYLKNKCNATNLEYYIPDRYTEGYGVSIKGIDYAAENDFSLILVTDCGVKAVEKVRYAKEKGVDIIICDHHTPGDSLPEAVAVLDPQRQDCDYPYKWLSGCGVSFKLVQAHSMKHNLPMSELYKLLDLLCVSIASDIVPITGENRILAYYGLQQLNEKPSLGLKTIIEVSGIDKEITINDIVFRIGPRINAAGRVESGNRAVDLLVADEKFSANDIASDINIFNDRRKKLDHDITEEAIAHITHSEIEPSRKTTVLFNPKWHKGVIGIVASRLTESFYRPTIVLTESNGMATGSARSVEGFDLYYAISQCSELLENYGGHKYAAGLTLKIENIEPFRKKFEQIVQETINEEMLTPQINIDAKIKLSDITPELYNMLQKFAPFGPNNTIPVFMTENVTNFIGTRRVGRNNEHLKLVVVDDTRICSDRSGIGFGMGHLYDEVNSGKYFSICYSLQENEFMGKIDIQMMLKDIKFNKPEKTEES